MRRLDVVRTTGIGDMLRRATEAAARLQVMFVRAIAARVTRTPRYRYHGTVFRPPMQVVPQITRWLPARAVLLANRRMNAAEPSARMSQIRIQPFSLILTEFW